MGDAPFLNSEGPAQTSPPPAENSVFQSQSPVFVLMRICIYIALSMGISFVLQWIMAALLAGDRSLYSPKILAISEGSSLAGALAAGNAMSHLGGRFFCVYGPPARGSFWRLVLAR